MAILLQKNFIPFEIKLQNTDIQIFDLKGVEFANNEQEHKNNKNEKRTFISICINCIDANHIY